MSVYENLTADKPAKNLQSDFAFTFNRLSKSIKMFLKNRLHICPTIVFSKPILTKPLVKITNFDNQPPILSPKWSHYSSSRFSRFMPRAVVFASERF